MTPYYIDISNLQQHCHLLSIISILIEVVLCNPDIGSIVLNVKYLNFKWSMPNYHGFFYFYIIISIYNVKPLHNCDMVSVHFNHFHCMGICDKLNRHLSMLTYIYLNVDDCCLASSMPLQRFKLQISLNYGNI